MPGEPHISYLFREGLMYWRFQVGRDKVPKDQVPDLPLLSATTWANRQDLHLTVPDSRNTVTCPATKLHDVARVETPACDGQLVFGEPVE